MVNFFANYFQIKDGLSAGQDMSGLVVLLLCLVCVMGGYILRTWWKSGEMTVADITRLLKELKETLAICQAAQKECRQMQSQFIESPDLLCKKFDDCPATKDSRSKSAQSLDQVKAYLERMEGIAERTEAIVKEFSQNMTVQILKALEIMTAATGARGGAGS